MERTLGLVFPHKAIGRARLPRLLVLLNWLVEAHKAGLFTAAGEEWEDGDGEHAERRRFRNADAGVDDDIGVEVQAQDAIGFVEGDPVEEAGEGRETGGEVEGVGGGLVEGGGAHEEVHAEDAIEGEGFSGDLVEELDVVDEDGGVEEAEVFGVVVVGGVAVHVAKEEGVEFEAGEGNLAGDALDLEGELIEEEVAAEVDKLG